MLQGAVDPDLLPPLSPRACAPHLSPQRSLQQRLRCLWVPAGEEPGASVAKKIPVLDLRATSWPLVSMQCTHKTLTWAWVGGQESGYLGDSKISVTLHGSQLPGLSCLFYNRKGLMAVLPFRKDGCKD